MVRNSEKSSKETAEIHHVPRQAYSPNGISRSLREKLSENGGASKAIAECKQTNRSQTREELIAQGQIEGVYQVLIQQDHSIPADGEEVYSMSNGGCGSMYSSGNSSHSQDSEPEDSAYTSES
jgi:hypothetical protein